MHTVIETDEFVRRAKKLGLSEQEIDLIKLVVANNPSAGNVVSGTGGARKVRIPARGRGKSGGYRVITFYSGVDLPVFLLNVYSKGSKGDLTEWEKILSGIQYRRYCEFTESEQHERVWQEPP